MTVVYLKIQRDNNSQYHVVYDNYFKNVQLCLFISSSSSDENHR